MFRKMRLPTTIVMITLLSVSCEREFDSPPIPTIPQGGVITLSELRNMYTGVDVSITDTLSVYAVVSMDESSGNLYKEAYVQDATTSMYLRFTSASGLYQGDSIRIYLPGTTLKNYNQMLQLDSLDADRNIFKQATQSTVTAEAASLVDIAVNSSYYQSRLVVLEGVEFSCDDLGMTFADGVNQQSENRYLQDAQGNQLIVRTSGYANFAEQEVPILSGSVTAIVSQYNDDVQLLLRHPDELLFTADRMDDCDGNTVGAGNIILSKDFDDQSVTSGGWTTQLVTGPSNCDWGIYEAANSAAKVTNWDGSANSVCESWLISPTVNLTATMPLLSFRNTYNYNGDALEVYVSTDYTGGDPASANWTAITNMAAWSSGSWEWVSSGDIDLSSYISTNVHIAFKYTGGAMDGSTWELDDIIIVDNQ